MSDETPTGAQTADDAMNFGERMAAYRKARGIKPGGRPPLAEKYKGQIGQAQRIFANGLPAAAQEYVDELHVKAPEVCEEHGGILRCSTPGCQTVSRRTYYNHKAAAYMFDRIIGKPTARVENTITVRLVAELTEAFITAFIEVNEYSDAASRREAFASRLVEIGAVYGG